MKKKLGIILALVLALSLVLVPATPVMAADIPVTVELKDSTGAGLSGGVVEYYYSKVWQYFGTTEADGKVSKAIPDDSYFFRMTYAGALQQKEQNVITNPVVVFQTTLVTMQLLDSGNNELDGVAEYCVKSPYKTFGEGTTTTTMELLPLNYFFRVSYEGASQAKQQDVDIDPVVVFQTTLVTMQLLDFTGTNELDGVAEYSCWYLGKWSPYKTFGEGTTTTTMELLPLNYFFRVSYAGASQAKQQDVGTDPVVVFQTGKVVDGGFGCNEYRYTVHGYPWTEFEDGIQLLPGYFYFQDNGPPVVWKSLEVKVGHTLNLRTGEYTVWATVVIDPNTINLRSKGKWITAYIELPKGYDPNQIDLSTVRLNATVEAVTDPSYDFVTDASVYLTDKDSDGVLERMVKFDAASVQKFLELGDNELWITGGLSGYSGVPYFEGSDTVRAK